MADCRVIYSRIEAAFVRKSSSDHGKLRKLYNVHRVVAVSLICYSRRLYILLQQHIQFYHMLRLEVLSVWLYIPSSIWEKFKLWWQLDWIQWWEESIPQLSHCENDLPYMYRATETFHCEIAIKLSTSRLFLFVELIFFFYPKGIEMRLHSLTTTSDFTLRTVRASLEHTKKIQS